MRFPFNHHPQSDQLSDFISGHAGKSRARIAAHLERCQLCRDSLQFLRSVNVAAAETPTIGPSSEVLTRVLASRASDTRIILPIADATKAERHRWLVPAAAAAALILLGGALVTRNANQVEASTTSGTLTFTPRMPRAGQSVVVNYRPSGMLSGQPWLALRARLRTPNDESYNVGIPTSRAAVLRRDNDGVFTGRFVMPDSVVYAAFAVEDSAASVIDDNASRSWELLVSDTTGKPRYESLDQRANDMMGRNWEEGFATARRMVAIYPRDLRAWNWLNSFDSWLGRADDDSVHARRREVFASFDSTFASGTAPTPEQEGLLAWFARTIDSTTAVRWRTRLLREAPGNSIAVQWRLFAILDTLRVRNDTAKAFQQLDALWTEAPRDRQAQVAGSATNVAFDMGDTALVKRWTTRLLSAERDGGNTARSLATQFARTPALRADGIQRLRNGIDALAELSPSERALDETVSEQRDRHAATRRRLLATLGQALVATGDYAAGREALAEAASKGWNLNVFTAVRTASLAAGDTARALAMAARVAIDPRTSIAFADSVRPIAEQILGAAGWRSQLDSARGEFVKRMLEDAPTRSLSGAARVRNQDGHAATLAELTKGQVTVLAFWSRFCGPAIEELPRLNAVAAHLARDGMHLVSIVDEANASKDLTAFLKEKDVTVPTYLDSWHESSRALNQWATPSYYVVDTDGRIRFDVTNSADEALTRAEALRMAEVKGGR